MLTKQEKQAIMKEYATKEGDTGFLRTNRCINCRYQQIKWSLQTTSKR